jgi:hypothetical protein
MRLGMIYQSIRRFSNLGEAKIGNIKESIKGNPANGKGLFGKYCQRYFASGTKTIGPILHLAVVAGGLGYYFDYDHQSTE